MWPPVVVGSFPSSNSSCCHTWSVFSAHGTAVAPQTPSRDSRVPQGASAFFKSHLRKRGASISLSERGVLRQGGAGDCVPKPHHGCDLWAKDPDTSCSYFRGRWGNSIILRPACQDLENQMLMALRLPIYKVTVPPYPSQVFLPHCLRYSSSPGPLPSFSLVLAQHTTPLTMVMQPCWEIMKLTKFKNPPSNEKKN